MSRQLKMESIGALVDKVEMWNPRSGNPSEGFTYIDISSINRDEKSIVEVSEILCTEAPSRARQLVNAGDVLVSTVRPNLNGVAYVPPRLDGATASTGFCVLRPKPEKLCSKYLFHWVTSPIFVRKMTKKATGQSYPAVSDAIVKDSEIPLPPLPEQKRIAAILDKADAIRRKRAESLRLTEQCLQSVFLDMFGDPVTNPKGWDVKRLDSLADVTTGNTPPRKRPDFYGEGIEWIKSDNINTPSHFLTPASEHLSDKGKAVGRVAPPLSILVTCIAGSPACIGNAAIADREVAFNQQINALIPRPGTDPYFLYFLVKLSRRLIQAASTNSMKGMVSKSALASVEVPAGPHSLQSAFGTVFERAIQTGERLAMAEAQSEALFGSLTQRAFRGDLS